MIDTQHGGTRQFYSITAILSLIALLPAAALADDVDSCQPCHEDIYTEWEASRHKMSWSADTYQTSLETAEDPAACAACHNPTMVLYDGVGTLPQPRTEYLEFGVNCISCHMDDYSIMHGPFGAESTGHSSEKNALFIEQKAEALCLTCHGEPSVPDHSLRASFESRPEDQADKSCVDCHMPEVTRAHAFDVMDILEVPERPGRKHTFHGSHDPEMSASAFTVHIGKDGAVEVRNTGAGHGIPAGITKTLFVHLAAMDPGGKTLAESETEIRQADQILPGETWDGRIDVPAGTGKIRVTLQYRVADHQPPEEYLTVGIYTEVVK